MNLLPSWRVVSWMVTSSQPSLPRLFRSFWTSSITGLLVPLVWSVWIRVFMGVTLYSHCGVWVILEFAGVFGFIDVIC